MSKKKPEDLYAEIRKHHLLEGLVHGLKYIITRRGVPMTPKINYNSMVVILKHVHSIAPEVLDEIEVLNIITSKRYSAKEILMKEKVIKK